MINRGRLAKTIPCFSAYQSNVGVTMNAEEIKELLDIISKLIKMAKKGYRIETSDVETVDIIINQIKEVIDGVEYQRLYGKDY